MILDFSGDEFRKFYTVFVVCLGRQWVQVLVSVHGGTWKKSLISNVKVDSGS